MAAEWPTVDTSAESDADEALLVAALRQGDEAAFMTLVDQYHASLVRLAQLYVQNREQAEEVAQEAWLGVLRGIERFEGRSSLRTWLFRILTNIAKTRGQREARSIPFSARAFQQKSSGPAPMNSMRGAWPLSSGSGCSPAGSPLNMITA